MIFMVNKNTIKMYIYEIRRSEGPIDPTHMRNDKPTEGRSEGIGLLQR